MTNAPLDGNSRNGLLAKSSTTGEAFPILGDPATGAVFIQDVTVSGADSSRDAFSRLRVSNPTTLFQSQSTYTTESLLYEAGATGTGVAAAHNANTRMNDLVVDAGTGTSFFQSYEYTPYQPGKSQLVFITFVMGSAVANVTKDVGYFDANNGIIFRQNGTSGLQFIRRTSTSGSVVNNSVNQANWNIDPMDGNGPSGITLDVSKAQILVIDLQFLAMGRVRCGFDIGGTIFYVHEFLNANNLTVPYMQLATLPVGALVTAASSGSSATFSYKCATVISEGGFAGDQGYHFSTPEGTVTAASGARTHILSIRPKTTFNSLTNRTRFALQTVDIMVTGANPVYWELCIGSTFSAGPTYADVNTTYSAYEYGTGGTLSAAGTVIASGYNATNGAHKTAVSAQIGQFYPISLDRAGAVRANGTLSLLVSGIGGTSASRAAFNFIEIR